MGRHEGPDEFGDAPHRQGNPRLELVVAHAPSLSTTPLRPWPEDVCP
jgi:hypothetical protein